jgi:hypothetical protein
MRAIRKDQRDIQARRDAMNKGRRVESGFGNGVKLGPGKWRFVKGEWFRIEEAPPIKIAKSDAVNIPSSTSGCTRSQVADFNKTFGHMGVTYMPNGKAVYKNVAAQERVLAARGMFNRNSNRSPKNF